MRDDQRDFMDETRYAGEPVATLTERRCGVCGRPEGQLRGEGLNLVAGHVCEQCAHMSESRPFTAAQSKVA